MKPTTIAREDLARVQARQRRVTEAMREHHDLIHQVEVNILRASSVALEGWRKGWAVICPHKNTSNFQHAHDIDWETWVRGDLEFLLRMDPDRGDAICMLPRWRQSDGARWEKRLAEQHGLRVIDYETDGLPEAAAG